MSRIDLPAIKASKRTALMGILNVTPDSYFDGSRFNTVASAFAHAHQLQESGADIIDIGGESTRPPTFYHPGEDPHSFQVTADEEIARVIPVLEKLHGTLTVPISIDTVKPEVARRAVTLGASMINDVTGFRDPEMRQIAAETGVAVCVCHMQGDMATREINPQYPDGVVPTIIHFFEQQIEKLVSEGVAEENICLDPGIGFGKPLPIIGKFYRICRNLKVWDFLFFWVRRERAFLQRP